MRGCVFDSRFNLLVCSLLTMKFIVVTLANISAITFTSSIYHIKCCKEIITKNITTQSFFVKYLCFLDFLINCQYNYNPFSHLHFSGRSTVGCLGLKFNLLQDLGETFRPFEFLSIHPNHMDIERQLVKFSDLDFKYQINEDEFRLNSF